MGTEGTHKQAQNLALHPEDHPSYHISRQEANVSQGLASSEQRSDSPSKTPSISSARPVSGSHLYLHGASAAAVVVSGCYGTDEFVSHLQRSSEKLSHISLTRCPWAKLTLPHQTCDIWSGCNECCNCSKWGLMYKQQQSGQPAWASHLRVKRISKLHKHWLVWN